MSNEWSQALLFLKKLIVDAWFQVVGEDLDINVVTLEVPADNAHGDWSCGLAMKLYKFLPSDVRARYPNPRFLAEGIADFIKKNLGDSEYLDQVQVAGGGFINFYLSQTCKLSVFAKWLEDCGQVSNGKQVIVEYSSPNIAKPFTVGHLRSTVIGDALANLLEATGWEVFRDNHLGDWGTQFAKQIVAIEKWGDWVKIDRAFSPIRALVDLYVRFHEEAEKDPTLEDEARRVFVRLEAGDEQYLSQWRKVVEMSLKEFAETYRLFGIHFTENDGQGYGESFVRHQTAETVAELRELGLLSESQGATVVEFAPEDKLPPLLILKKDGSTLYQTRDLAMDRWRRQHYGQSIVIINEAGREQDLYFRQLYRVEEMAGWYKPGQRIHVGHGMYRFRDRKMSTRRGDVIWLTDILDQARERVGEIATTQLDEQDITTISVGAIKWNDLARDPRSDISFDLEAMINLKGNSGSYMQYTAVRVQSILQKAENEANRSKGIKTLINRGELHNDWLTLRVDELNRLEWGLVDKLNLWGETLRRAADELAPYLVAGYLYALAQAFNNYYATHEIRDHRERLIMTKAIGLVLTQGLGILGIEIPGKM